MKATVLLLTVGLAAGGCATGGGTIGSLPAPVITGTLPAVVVPAGVDPERPWLTETPACVPSVTLDPSVLFATDSSTVQPAALPALRDLPHELCGDATTPLVVTGYTDDTGTPAYNLALSGRRAASVASILRAEGFTRVIATGRGESDPIATNSTPAGRALNRRVTVAESP